MRQEMTGGPLGDEEAPTITSLSGQWIYPRISGWSKSYGGD